ncbi:SS18 family [Sesbania bispinosa]|nr:SS18 family [Sesbania bispinosa]
MKQPSNSDRGTWGHHYKYRVTRAYRSCLELPSSESHQIWKKPCRHNIPKILLDNTSPIPKLLDPGFILFINFSDHNNLDKMQQTPQMIPMMPSFPPTNITTEQIQKYLDENKKLILAILDNQNLGKLAECAQYQAQLQKNLMYLAAIADAQPQTPAMPPQMTPHPAMHPEYYMQHSQAAAMAQQQGIFTPKMALQFGNPHQMQDPQQQLHQQAIQGQMGLRPRGINNGMHPMHSEATLGGGSSGGPPATTAPNDVRGGSKQDASEAGTAGGDGQRNSAAVHNSGDVE